MTAFGSASGATGARGEYEGTSLPSDAIEVSISKSGTFNLLSEKGKLATTRH
jgi:hypothetical protein